MKNLDLQTFLEVVGGKPINITEPKQNIAKITIDSRRLQNEAVFFALKGIKSDGHDFINDAIKKGAAVSVVSNGWFNLNSDCKLPLVIVENPLEAMQKITLWWRKKLVGKMIGVTGSNGKTIVKDALVQLLNSTSYNCVGNPDSFNSQIGVPLSLTRIPLDVDFIVLEAGIYNRGDMAHLEPLIQPNYGIFTNVGYAHIASFKNSRKAIAQEKAQLFKNIPKDGWLLIPQSDEFIEGAVKSLKLSCPIYRVGDKNFKTLPYINDCKVSKNGTKISIQFPEGQTINTTIAIPSRDVISNIEIAVCAAYLLNTSIKEIEKALSNYVPGIGRMEMWKSPTGVTLINDTCSSDPLSVLSSLRTLKDMKNGGRSFFVFGGMRDLGDIEKQEHEFVGKIAADNKVDNLILFDNENADATKKSFIKNSSQGKAFTFTKTHDVKNILSKEKIGWGDVILVKGSRYTGIDKVAREIIDAMAPTRYYIDLQAIEQNLQQFQSLVGKKTKILAMVKALAYGSDAGRLSIELQNMGIEYFGVANVDEGIALRKAGITKEILVMMTTVDEAEKVIAEKLTPNIYSLDMIKPLAENARNKKQTQIIDVHIEIDTGLGRVGIRIDEVKELIKSIKREKNLRVVGLMTHFACADDPTEDDFTNLQIKRFIEVKNTFHKMGFSNFLCHASATSGAVRFPKANFDLIRLGLGMFGVYPSNSVEKEINLSLAVSLVSRVIEVRNLRKGDRIGYGSTFKVQKDNHLIGVVPIGYHDGIPWNLSNKGKVLVNGKEAHILGRISMDSMIIDLSDHPESEVGTNVLIYGDYNGNILRPETVAQMSETISYELLARLGPRVQRIYLGQEDHIKSKTLSLRKNT